MLLPTYSTFSTRTSRPSLNHDGKSIWTIRSILAHTSFATIESTIGSFCMVADHHLSPTTISGLILQKWGSPRCYPNSLLCSIMDLSSYANFFSSNSFDGHILAALNLHGVRLVVKGSWKACSMVRGRGWSWRLRRLIRSDFGGILESFWRIRFFVTRFDV